MAKLPSALSLGESPTPAPQRGVQTYRGGMAEAAVVDAAEGLTRTGYRVMQAGEQVQQRVDRLEYSRGRSAFLRAKVEADNAFAEDQDYATFETRYRDRLKKGLDEAAKRISNGAVREAFVAEAGLEFERGALGIREFARGKEKDANRAFLNEDLTASLQTALQADQQTAMAILESVNVQINASKEKGYLTAQEAQKLGRDFAANYAVSRIQMLPHEKQLELLTKGMTAKEGALPVFSKQGSEVDFIPPDKRVELIRAAEVKTKQGQAIRMADEIAGPMGSGMDLTGWMKQAQGIADPVLREAVESRLTTEFNRRSAVKTEAERANRETAWGIVFNTKSMDSLTGQQLAALSPTDRISMETYVQRQGQVPENPVLYNEINRMRIEEPEKFRTFDTNTLNGRLPAEQVRKFSDLQVTANSTEQKALEKAQADEQKRLSIKSALGVARGTLKNAGINVNAKPGTEAAENLAAFESALIDRLDAFQTEKKGKATEKEILGIIDGLLLQGEVRGGGVMGLYDPDKRAYQLTPEERDKFYIPFSDIPAKDKALITQALQQKGKPVTNAAVEDLYARSKMGATSGR